MPFTDEQVDWLVAQRDPAQRLQAIFTYADSIDLIRLREAWRNEVLFIWADARPVYMRNSKAEKTHMAIGVVRVYLDEDGMPDKKQPATALLTNWKPLYAGVNLRIEAELWFEAARYAMQQMQMPCPVPTPDEHFIEEWKCAVGRKRLEIGRRQAAAQGQQIHIQWKQ